jgi:tripartite ATP-independent transporter DctM subunit
MSLATSIIIIVVVLLVSILSGIKIFVAIGTTALIGLCFLIPYQPEILGQMAWDCLNNFTFISVPMFILLGELLTISGITSDLYTGIARWLVRVPGALGHSIFVSCAIFSAIAGSSTATAATFGVITYPELTKRGYDSKVTTGMLASGGTLGILIPPSIPMIIYGSMCNVSVARCYMAGIIPGILLTAAFMVTLVFLVWRRPEIIPKSVEVFSLREKLVGTLGVLPAILLIFLVLGFIYIGITTPTEAAGVGAFGAFVLCLVKRTLTWQKLNEAMLATVKTTSLIFIIVIAAYALSYVVSYLRIPSRLLEYLITLNISKWFTLSIIYLFYFILGCLVDSISMMVMTLPVVFPVIVGLGFDPVWFAVTLTICMEIGLITPPLGMNLYVLQGVCNVPLGDVIAGSVPFLTTMLIMLALFTVFPILSLWLPATM